jgi:hypothetical protein
MTFERVTNKAIERADGDASGVVRGVIATEGEASDGHVLSVAGGVCEPGALMCFGHDSWRQEGTVGAWQDFAKTKKQIRGVGQIETGGVGANAEARQDLAYMVDRKIFRGLSVSWDPIDEPQRRVNLSKDHPAFIDSAKETDWRKIHGFYFPTWRLREASIVPIGSDPRALMDRMRETSGAARTLWRDTLGAMLSRGAVTGPTAETVARFRAVLGELRALGVDDFGTLLRACGDTALPDSLHAVEYGEGKRVLLPREAYDALTRESTQRLELALDLVTYDGSVDEDEDELLERDEPDEEPDREALARAAAETAAPVSPSLDQVRAEIASAFSAHGDALMPVLRANARAAAGR